MFKRRTLFICGAGTSHEAGLPLGVGLAERIARMTDIRFGPNGYEPIGQGNFELYQEIKQTVPLGAMNINEQHRSFATAWAFRNQ